MAAGGRLTHVCREAGMPDASTVAGWARREPWFAARLATAKAQGEGRRRGLLDAAAAAEILRRLAGGEPIRDVLRGPGMPSRQTYAGWRRMDAEFAGEVHRINGAKAEARAHGARSRFRHFDRALADKVIVRVSQGVGLRGLARLGEGLPGPRVVERWRGEDADFDTGLAIAMRVARRLERRTRTCTPQTISRIAERVFLGATLAEVARDRRAPCRTTLYAWMRTRPAFREAIARARRWRAEEVADQALGVAERPGWEVGRGREVRALMRKADRLTRRAERDTPGR